MKVKVQIVKGKKDEVTSARKNTSEGEDTDLYMFPWYTTQTAFAGIQ